jgi:hypothetical protein
MLRLCSETSSCKDSQAAVRERHRLLVVGFVDPEAAVFRFHVECEVPQ